MMTVGAERPWQVSFSWSTGFSGVENFASRDRALVFWRELLLRATPDVDVKVSAEHRETHEVLLPPIVGKNCGTCDGAGGWTEIKTQKWKPCSRCNGTGQE